MGQQKSTYILFPGKSRAWHSIGAAIMGLKVFSKEGIHLELVSLKSLFK